MEFHPISWYNMLNDKEIFREDTMPVSAGKNRFTYNDYMTWAESERWELINGKAYNMTPAPNLEHQNMGGSIYRKIADFLEGKECEVYIAPVDVVLSDSDIVQPDVVIVCDPNKLTKKNFQGAPDVVFEILSPNTAIKDRAEKRDLYERYGVKEYCLVEPKGRFVEKYVLAKSGTFAKSQIFGEKDRRALQSLPGFTLDIQALFGTQTKAKPEEK
ncbi:Uma2 family endonuclease [bacterium]|nr:Uma2 family endonuclease [bacterium]